MAVLKDSYMPEAASVSNYASGRGCWMSQSFITTSAYTMTKIVLKLKKSSDADGHTWSVSLCANDSDKPGSILATFGTFNENNDLTTSYQEYTFEDTTYDVSDSTKYVIAIKTDDEITTSEFYWWTSTDDGYANGRRCWGNYNEGWKFTDSNYDASFKIWGENVPSKPINPGPANEATDVDVATTDNLTWDAGGVNTDTFDVYFGSDSGDLEQLPVSGITDDFWASPYVVLEIEDFNVPVTSGYRSPEVGDVLTSGDTSYTIWNIKKGALVNVNYEAKLFAYRVGPNLIGENGKVLTNGVAPDVNNPQAVSVTLNNSPFFSGEVESAYYPYGHTYYWRIDATNDAGTTTGDEWSFTTWALNPPLPSFILLNGLGPLEGGVEGTDWNWGGGYNLIKRLVAAAKDKIYYEDR